VRRHACAIATLLLCAAGPPALAGDLVRQVRAKIAAGDVATGAAAVEDYKAEHGADAEYLDAVGWLARGAEMLGKRDLADLWVAELRREIPEEKAGLTIPFGAAIEVEGRLLAAREGRGAALRYFEESFAAAKDTALRARIRKNVNLLSLEGQPAPEIARGDFFGPEPPAASATLGRPVLLFFWAHWCGDCRAQAASLARVVRKYVPQGLAVIAATRYYGTGEEDKEMPPAEEKRHMTKVWAESYAGLERVPVVIDTETMVRYGVSATPTFVLVDRRGLVRTYAPTRLSEAELSRRIDALLAETPGRAAGPPPDSAVPTRTSSGR
jgi:thiol-disulfide isomerase/thioredoxin